MAIRFNSAIPISYADAPGVVIPNSTAKDMIQAYKNIHNSNGSRTIYTDLDREKLNIFLDRFPGADGIRIYNGLTATGNHTFIIVPTIKVDETNCRVEFAPIIEDDGDVAWAFDFGTLCPPGGNCNCECDGVNGNPISMARQVYENLICPPPTP